MKDSAADFHTTMATIFERARDETGYIATRFIQMVSEHGGLATARKLLETTDPSDGFSTLWEKGRLDLSVEAHVIDPRFADLFTAAERQTARNRLAQYGYSPDDFHDLR